LICREFLSPAHVCYTEHALTAHKHTHIHSHTHARAHTFTHTCIHTHAHIRTCTHTHTHTFMHMHTHTRTHTHTHTHKYTLEGKLARAMGKAIDRNARPLLAPAMRNLSDNKASVSWYIRAWV
jgi:hypothetical protein